MLFESQSFGEVEKNSFNCLPSKGGHIRLMPWGSSDGKESTCTAGDMGSIPGLGRCPGGGHSNPLQYSYLENPHGERSLEGYSPWDCKESDVTEQQSTQHNWWGLGQVSSVQSLSRIQLCNPMDCSTPGLPVYHQLWEFTQTHVQWVGGAIQQPSHTLLSLTLPAFNHSWNQGPFK